METMTLPAIHLFVNAEDFQELGMTPWFSYSVTLPERPVPSASDRPAIETERLVIRPFDMKDLDAFHELRHNSDLQKHSTARGGATKDKSESERQLHSLVQDDQSHWWFGAFLKSTNECIGEGGLADVLTMSSSLSGWPEAEFLIKPEYCRQGYGTELFTAVMDSWWNLPRERRRHQLIPLVAPGKEPGDKMRECVVFQWEAGNEAATQFFAKMLAQAPVVVQGGCESIDTRPGKEGTLITWAGTMIANPKPMAEEDSDSE
ncbi:n- gnat protein [Fusarium austroafricanum]|uniref:N- gnat protein n=1 Tax=Fusarium austroafricanum TaxID=2364996 RepID=A0A8H4KAI8_9HYPO|nr:n- gnat protein [Fusarium austroafricanum]